VFREPVVTVESMLHALPSWLDRFWRRDRQLASVFFPRTVGEAAGKGVHQLLARTCVSVVELR
jgi:hypothetical protein